MKAKVIMKEDEHMRGAVLPSLGRLSLDQAELLIISL
jgi:hypothetical protein